MLSRFRAIPGILVAIALLAVTPEVKAQGADPPFVVAPEIMSHDGTQDNSLQYTLVGNFAGDTISIILNTHATYTDTGLEAIRASGTSPPADLGKIMGQKKFALDPPNSPFVSTAIVDSNSFMHSNFGDNRSNQFRRR